MTITEQEKATGKCWNHWTQAEWDEVLKHTEFNDLKYPLIINKVMEAYMNNRLEVLTESVKTYVKLIVG